MSSAKKIISKEELRKELQVIEAAKSNPQRFGVLYEKYYRQIFLFVFKRTGDEQVCGDVVSQVFLKAMVSLKGYKYKGVPFSAWLYRIASNEVNQYYRSQKRERTVSMEKEDIERIMEIASGDSAGNDLFAEYQDILVDVMEELAENDLQLVEMRYFEKRPFRDVAFILGITENNAKVRASRILKRMQKKMAARKGKLNE